MIFIAYVLGILTGLVIALLVGKYQVPLQRFRAKVDEITPPFKQIAEILPLADEKADAIAEIFEQNDKRGKDTPLNELE